MNIEEVKQIITPILLRYGIKRAAVFGSVARGQAKKNSDVEAWIQFDNDEPIMIMDNINDDVTITLPISKDLGES